MDIYSHVSHGSSSIRGKPPSFVPYLDLVDALTVPEKTIFSIISRSSRVKKYCTTFMMKTVTGLNQPFASVRKAFFVNPEFFDQHPSATTTEGTHIWGINFPLFEQPTIRRRVKVPHPCRNFGHKSIHFSEIFNHYKAGMETESGNTRP